MSSPMRRRPGRCPCRPTSIARRLTRTVSATRPCSRAVPARWPLEASTGETSLFIYPGFRFSVVDLMLTNFHLPKSTLFMLVCALAGRERTLEAYRVAAAQRYRFYSYGDAMLIG